MGVDDLEFLTAKVAELEKELMLLQKLMHARHVCEKRILAHRFVTNLPEKSMTCVDCGETRAAEPLPATAAIPRCDHDLVEGQCVKCGAKP